jgi:hypothetical protein
VVHVVGESIGNGGGTGRLRAFLGGVFEAVSVGDVLGVVDDEDGLDVLQVS